MVDTNAEISAQQTVSKFAGEEFDVGNVRTVFAGASKGRKYFLKERQNVQFKFMNKFRMYAFRAR